MTTSDIPSSLPEMPVPKLARRGRASFFESLAKSYAGFPNAWQLWAIIVFITVVAAFLRFWRIDFQTYWTDEAHTIYRTMGNFDRMIKRLDDQGFPPGWYVMVWWWESVGTWWHGNSAEAFTPNWLRALPAILGTLTVPAMFFLARQFMSRRWALVVMFLAAINPFLIYYSRDIKMYAALWFFLTLNMALFFQWQNSARHWRYWLWFPLFLLSGACAVAIHSAAWFVIPLQVIFIFTRSKPRWLDAPLWLVAVGAMSVLPIWWYDYHTRWLDNAEEGKRIGVEWNSEYTDMDWKTVASLPSAHLLGFLWPEQPPTPKVANWFGLDERFNEHLDTRSSPLIANAEFYAILALFAILILGLIPWRGRKRSVDAENKNPATRGRWWWIALWIIVPPLALGMTWLQPVGYTSVTSEAQVSDATAPLDSPGLGLNSAPKAGTFKINVQGYSPRARSVNSYTINLQPDPAKPMVSLKQLADQINAKTSREVRTRDPDGGRGTVTMVPFVAATVTDGKLKITGPSGEYVTAFTGDNANILPALGIKPHPAGSWYPFIWSYEKLPPLKIWEPRYLGIIVPGLLLWLGVCICRFPSWPVRVIVLAVVATGCVISSLSNHLIYRNGPAAVVAKIVNKYRVPDTSAEGRPDKKQIAWNIPSIQFLRLQDVFAAQNAAGIPPTPPRIEKTGDPKFTFWEDSSYFLPYRKMSDSKSNDRNPVEDGQNSVTEYYDFLYDFRYSSNLAAIVLTDRMGDLPDTITLPNGSTLPNWLSDAEIQKYLGPRWKLDSTTTYRWYYEWRFNIFHTWRTRVYVPVDSRPATPPTTVPTTTATPATPTTRPITPTTRPSTPATPPQKQGGTIFDF